MKNLLYIFMLSLSLGMMTSCASSTSTTAVASDMILSNYKYIAFGIDVNGDAEMADILLMIQNELSKRLIVVSPIEAQLLVEQGKQVLSPRINVKSERDGGRTYISINFYDCNTNMSVAVVKSSGYGWTISHDQKLAFSAMKKELDKVFKQSQ